MDRRGGSSRGINLPAERPPRKDAPARRGVLGRVEYRAGRTRRSGRLEERRDNVGPSAADRRDSRGGGKGGV